MHIHPALQCYSVALCFQLASAYSPDHIDQALGPHYASLAWQNRPAQSLRSTGSFSTLHEQNFLEICITYDIACCTRLVIIAETTHRGLEHDSLNEPGTGVQGNLSHGVIHEYINYISARIERDTNTRVSC